MITDSTAPVHGGPDDGPSIRVDFSTNAHPLGPNPFVLEMVRRADRTRYPDPRYAQLRRTLADFHGVEAQRVVIGGSASELIWRITRCWSEARGAAVIANERTFGEYLRAARALKVPVSAEIPAGLPTNAALHWCCNPDNPSGAVIDARIESLLGERGLRAGALDLIVADLAYEPFRVLLDESAATQPVTLPAWREHALQLWSPNKLHGLTGVRGAYLILPARPHPLIDADALNRLAVSWVLGAEGVTLLTAHTRPEAAAFLLATAPSLRSWKQRQDRVLAAAGWQAESSPLHYGLWKPPLDPDHFIPWLAFLRAHGIKVRDAGSFARPNWVRLVCRADADLEELVNLTNSVRAGQ